MFAMQSNALFFFRLIINCHFVNFEVNGDLRLVDGLREGLRSSLMVNGEQSVMTLGLLLTV